MTITTLYCSTDLYVYGARYSELALADDTVIPVEGSALDAGNDVASDHTTSLAATAMSTSRRNVLINRGYPFIAYTGRAKSSLHGNESLPVATKLV